MAGFVPDTSDMILEVCLNHFNAMSCILFIPTLAHPGITPYFTCSASSSCFPQRRGSKLKWTGAQERAQSRTKV